MIVSFADQVVLAVISPETVTFCPVGGLGSSSSSLHDAMPRPSRIAAKAKPFVLVKRLIFFILIDFRIIWHKSRAEQLKRS